MKVLASSILLVAIAGCESVGNTDVDLTDGPLLFPTCRVVVEIAPRAPVESGRVATVKALEIGATSVSGEGEDGIGQGTYVRAGNWRGEGPANLKFDYTLHEGAVLYRGGLRWPDREIVGLVGLGGVRGEFEVTDGASSGRRIEGRIGPMLGAQGAWEPQPDLDVYGRVTAFIYPDCTSLQGELGTGYRFLDWARGFVAYRGWRYWFGIDHGQLVITTHGLVTGLELRF